VAAQPAGLARTLTWPAAFGISHGLYEWGDSFISIQAKYMAAPFIDLMLGLQLVLLASSLACLFQVGVETLRPLPERWRWLRFAPGAITVEIPWSEADENHSSTVG
jgi:hypothetical protein